MKALSEWFRRNLRSNLIATAAIVFSAEQFTVAVEAWEKHQPANWRAAIISLIVAALGFVTKDANNHSTQAEVQAATIEKTK